MAQKREKVEENVRNVINSNKPKTKESAILLTQSNDSSDSAIELNEENNHSPDSDSDNSEADLTKLQYLKSTQISFVGEESRYESNVINNYEYFGKYLKFSDNLNLKVPSDNQNILNTSQDCLEILNTLYPLISLILGLEFEVELDQYIGDRIKWYQSSNSNIQSEKLLIEIKYKTLYLITKTARIVNEFLIKPEFTLADFKNLIKNTKKEADLDLIKNNFIDIRNVKEILEGISRIFPEIVLPNLTYNLKTTKENFIKPCHYSFKKDVELNPSSPQVQDIIEGLIKVKLWEKEENKLVYERRNKYPHENDKGKLEILKDNFQHIENLDYIDIKILIAIMAEAYYQPPKFYISCRKIAELIGYLDNKVIINGRVLSTSEKLKDIENRIERLKLVRYIWRHCIGETLYTNDPELGDLKSIKFNVIEVGIIVTFENDIYIEIELPEWYQFNKNTLKQNTRIPLSLLKINVNHNKHWRAFHTVYKILILFRIKKKNFVKYNLNDFTITLTTKYFVNELFSAETINSAQTNSKKGFNIKQKIIKDCDYIRNNFNWIVEFIGLEDKMNFNEFYNKTSIKVQLEPKIESEIIGDPSISVSPQLIENLSKSHYKLSPEELRILRKNINMNQSQFAESLNLSRTYISKLENGKLSITPQIYKRIEMKFKPHILKLKSV